MSGRNEDFWQTMIWYPEQPVWFPMFGDLRLEIIVGSSLVPLAAPIMLSKGKDLKGVMSALGLMLSFLLHVGAAYVIFTGVQGGVVFEDKLKHPNMALAFVVVQLIGMALEVLRQQIDGHEDSDRALNLVTSLASHEESTCLSMAVFSFDSAYASWLVVLPIVAVIMELYLYLGLRPVPIMSAFCDLSSAFVTSYAMYCLTEDITAVLPFNVKVLTIISPYGHEFTKNSALFLVSASQYYLFRQCISLPDYSVPF